MFEARTASSRSEKGIVAQRARRVRAEWVKPAMTAIHGREACNGGK